jgi:hypothetical protein
LADPFGLKATGMTYPDEVLPFSVGAFSGVGGSVAGEIRFSYDDCCDSNNKLIARDLKSNTIEVSLEVGFGLGGEVKFGPLKFASEIKFATIRESLSYKGERTECGKGLTKGTTTYFIGAFKGIAASVAAIVLNIEGREHASEIDLYFVREVNEKTLNLSIEVRETMGAKKSGGVLTYQWEKDETVTRPLSALWKKQFTIP